jgi:ubiquinone/menaquinone biosynthesis C-methylase UbiE
VLGVVTTTPPRVRWAVGELGLRADARVLEVGGGTGASARLVCELLTTGHLFALDRSATATARISTSCADLVEAGRLTVVTGELAGLDVPSGSFDVAFSVGVTPFQTSAAARELAVLRRVLAPRGLLAVCYGIDGPQSSRRRERVLDPVAANVRRAGFVEVEQRLEDDGGGVIARNP